jgi:SHS family sialic acid transporter-like MFS transporter
MSSPHSPNLAVASAGSAASAEGAAGPVPLSRVGRWLVLAVAFLGWLFAGVQMSITPLVSNSATADFLAGPQVGTAERTATPKPVLTRWFARYNATFLFGAAAGGLLFGWIGDRAGRARALSLSICCYAIFSGLAAFARTPEQFVALRFLGCLGVGGAWPNGIAIAVEVWTHVSKPILAGIIGSAANVGLVLMGLLGCYVAITPESWRWVMLVGGLPVFLGAASLVWLPESPQWLAARRKAQEEADSAANVKVSETTATSSVGPAMTQASPTALKPVFASPARTLSSVRNVSPVRAVFQPPLLWLTLLGILLGAIPLFGGWGCTNWLVPWADQVGAKTDPTLKAWTQVYRSVGAAVTSAIGGWVSAKLGRRFSYFLYSAASLFIGQHLYNNLHPTHPHFNWYALMLGATTGFYFGWLPLCLPEMFPTAVRSTGSGVTFNTGRVATGLGVLGAGYLSSLSYFGGDYAKVGAVTSLIFAGGLAAIWLLPKTPPASENR